MPPRLLIALVVALLPGVAVAQEIPWQFERVMLRGDGVRAGRPVAGHLVRQGKELNADGGYTVVRADGGLLELGDNHGWVARADVVKLADAAAYFSARIKEEPTVAKWYGRRSMTASSQTLYVDVTGTPGRPRVVKGQPSERLDDLREAIRLDPNNVGWRGRLAVEFTALGELDKAAEECETILRLAPMKASSYGARAVVRQARKDAAGAVADLERALELDPTSIDVQTVLAVAYQLAGHKAKAEERFQRVAAMPATSSSDHSQRAFARAQIGDTDGALTDMAEAVRLDPADIELRRQRGCLLRRRGEYHAALSEFRRAARLQPGDRQAARMEAFLLATVKEDALRDGKRAVELAERAVKLAGAAPESADIEALAAAYAEAGDFQSAVAAQKRAIKLLEGQPVYYEQLSGLQWWRDEYDRNHPRRE